MEKYFFLTETFEQTPEVRIRIDPFQIISMNTYSRDGSLTNLVKQEEEEREDVTLYMFSE